MCSRSAGLPPLRDVLYRQRQRNEIEKEIGRKVEYVFHRRGNVIKEDVQTWRSACKRAGAHTGAIAVTPGLVDLLGRSCRRS